MIHQVIRFNVCDMHCSKDRLAPLSLTYVCSGRRSYSWFCWVRTPMLTAHLSINLRRHHRPISHSAHANHTRPRASPSLPLGSTAYTTASWFHLKHQSPAHAVANTFSPNCPAHQWHAAIRAHRRRCNHHSEHPPDPTTIYKHPRGTCISKNLRNAPCRRCESNAASAARRSGPGYASGSCTCLAYDDSEGLCLVA